jgi:NAD(P)-dependent dehydrogenase (short-subunit alcohol dehydrogenase family)
MAAVLVTGAGSGIGEATVVAFAHRGDIVYAGVHTRSRSGTMTHITTGDVRIVELDVTDPDAAGAVVGRIVEEVGTLDVVVNCAGVGTAGSVEEIDLAVARRMVDVNLWGAFHVMRAVLPVMRAQASGVIINVSSINARMSANPGVAVYGMSKQALSFLSESCREEVTAFGIRVVAAEPGLVATPIYEKNRPTIDSSSPYAELLTNVDENVSKSIADGYPPSDTAAGIVAIVEDPDAPARVLIGPDAIEWFGEPPTST